MRGPTPPYPAEGPLPPMHPAASALWSQALSAAPQPPPPGPLDGVLRFFQDGGSFMFVNVLLLAIALAVVIERTYALWFRYGLNAAPFMEQVQRQVTSGNVDRAVKLCAHVPNAPLAKVIRAGLLRANKGELEVAKSVEEAMLEHTPPLTHRISWLWSLANIATLIGLVGTIAGLIKTFQSLGNVPADQKQALLSAGIAKAMNNTAFGLGIAVFCIVCHLVIGSHSKRLVETIELHALKLENLLSRRGEDRSPASLDEAA